MRYLLLLLASVSLAFCDSTEQESQAQALRKFPSLGTKNSPLNLKFLALYNDAKQSNSALLANPSWPMVLAEQADAALRDPAAPVAAVEQAMKKDTVVAPEIPTIRATIIKSGHKLLKGSDFGTEADVKAYLMTVGVELRSFRLPRESYDVQCFFFVNVDKGGGESVIWDVKRQKAGGISSKHEFSADTVTGSVGKYSISDGLKLSGWVVRVLSEGKVVRLESNQPGLRDFAVKESALLDAEAEKIKQK